MRRVLGATILLALLASGCGYTLVGTGRQLLPATVKTAQIKTFENKTTRAELEQRITRAVADEFVSRGRLTLVSNPVEADVIVTGTITGFGINPVAFDAQGRATQYQASVTAKIELVDHKNDDAVLWKNDQYYFAENYPINPDTNDTFDQETQAINQISVRFAETLVSSILEGF